MVGSFCYTSDPKSDDRLTGDNANTYYQSSGRLSVPYVLLYYLPENCNPNQRMSYAGAVELMRSQAEVNRVIEVSSAEEITDIETKLAGDEWAKWHPDRSSKSLVDLSMTLGRCDWDDHTSYFVTSLIRDETQYSWCSLAWVSTLQEWQSWHWSIKVLFMLCQAGRQVGIHTWLVRTNYTWETESYHDHRWIVRAESPKPCIWRLHFALWLGNYLSLLPVWYLDHSCDKNPIVRQGNKHLLVWIVLDICSRSGLWKISKALLGPTPSIRVWNLPLHIHTGFDGCTRDCISRAVPCAVGAMNL